MYDPRFVVDVSSSKKRSEIWTKRREVKEKDMDEEERRRKIWTRRRKEWKGTRG